MIRKAQNKDLESLSKMANCMWGGKDIEGRSQEFSLLMSKDDAIIFLKIVDGEAIGFAQCQLRYDYVEGTDTSPVRYLEGIFVKEDKRNLGYAKELLTQCEQWAKERGCTEFASDCELNNEVSLAFHKALNFTESNRIICFTKIL